MLLVVDADPPHCHFRRPNGRFAAMTRDVYSAVGELPDLRDPNSNEGLFDFIENKGKGAQNRKERQGQTLFSQLYTRGVINPLTTVSCFPYPSH